MRWRSLKSDPAFRRLLGVVASDDLLVAHVPMMRSTGEPAWVFASWLGGHSQRARWLLKSVKHPDVQRAAARNGWLVWVWTPRELKGQRVTFALVEGMLVGCVARETMGIDDVLAGVDGHAVTLSDRPWLTLTERTGALDRGWFRNARGAFFPFQLALTQRSAQGPRGNALESPAQDAGVQPLAPRPLDRIGFASWPGIAGRWPPWIVPGSGTGCGMPRPMWWGMNWPA